MIRNLILIFLIAFPLVSFSQIMNFEKSRIEKKDTSNYWLANISASLSLSNVSAGIHNPVRIMGSNLVANAGYISGKHFYKLINKMDYLNVNKSVINNTGYSHFRISFNHEKTLHPEVFAQYQFDNIRGLHPRLLTGTGLRFIFLQKETLTLIVSPGVMYEYEKWAQPYIEDTFEVIQMIKSTNYVNARWKVNSHVDINGIFYFQTGYDRGIHALRNRYTVEGNILVKVSDKLNLKTTFAGSYESKPVVPIIPFIYALTNGLQFTL